MKTLYLVEGRPDWVREIAVLAEADKKLSVQVSYTEAPPWQAPPTASLRCPGLFLSVGSLLCRACLTPASAPVLHSLTF